MSATTTMKNLTLAILTVFLFASCHSAKILFSAMPQGRSHINSMLPLARRLAQEGHNVSIFFEIFRPELPFDSNLNNELILMTSENFIIDDDPQFIDIVWHGDFDAIGMFFPWLSSALSVNHLLTNQQDDYYRLANQSWDLVVQDTLFGGSGMSIAHTNRQKHGKPYILFQTSMMDPAISYYKRISRNWATVPIFMTHDKPDWSVEKFMDRVTAFKDTCLVLGTYIYPFQWMMRYVMSPVWPDFSFEQWSTQDSSVAMYNYPDRLDYVHSITREFVHVGAYCKPHKPLPKELEDFVNDPLSKGTILMAFGTIVRWDMAPKSAVNSMIEIMNEMKDYRFLWALHSNYSGENLNNRLPRNARASSWLPQVDILNHAKTNLFMSHGGLKSVTEAICAEVPVVYMSMFGEQIRNSLLARRWGFAEYINKKTFNAPHTIEMFHKVLRDNSYYENVKRAKSIWMDRPCEVMDQAVFLIHKMIKDEKFSEKFDKYYKHRDKTGWTQYFYVFNISVLMIVLKLVSM